MSVKNSDMAVVAAFVYLGSTAPSDLQKLLLPIRQSLPEAEAWISPDGIAVAVKSPNEKKLYSLVNLRDVITNIDIDSSNQLPQFRPETLADNLISIGYCNTLTNEVLKSGRIYVTGAAGNEFMTTSSGGISRIVKNVMVELDGLEVVQLGSMKFCEHPVESLKIWIQSQSQAGSFLRFYRYLDEPKSFTELVGRSLANAVFGGLGNSMISKILRDRYQYSYNPYSILTYRGGYQWVVVDVDTSRGFEKDVIAALHNITASDIEREFTERRIRHAGRFMLNLRKNVEIDPDLAVRLELTKVDGTDPYGVSFASEDDCNVRREQVVEVAVDMFNMQSMKLIAISKDPEPSWFKNIGSR